MGGDKPAKGFRDMPSKRAVGNCKCNGQKVMERHGEPSHFCVLLLLLPVDVNRYDPGSLCNRCSMIVGTGG